MIHGPPLADGTGQAANATLLLLGAGFVAWIAVRRLRGKALPRVPRPVAWAALGVAVALAALGLLLPSILAPSRARPASTVRIQISSPSQGQVLHGTQDAPALVPVRILVMGGRIVPFTSTRLRADEGHIHLFLDGALVSMSAATGASLDVAPGSHVLQVEFVAADHAPFDPRVVSTVRFTVVP
jgi:hypothetical protein